MQTLNKAYKIIFKYSPDDLKEWEIARDLMNNFNIQLLGEDLAKKVIFKVVNHIIYPNNEIAKEVVGRAEGFAGELFEELRDVDDIHMDDIADLERKYIEKERANKFQK